jgi:hypothetical protein
MNDRSIHRLLPFWWLFWAGAAVVVRLLSTGMLEAGDGVQHYQIARAAWEHPVLLLDHWGKPLFTLLSMPFAQLGAWGMTLFNALCFLATCWLADGVIRRTGNMLRILFAPALLLVPAYGSMVLAGMTEVLFGLLTVLILRALFDGRYALAAMVISFLPYARPEAIAVAPFFIGWLVWDRQWRALPWLMLGSVVYAVVGGFVWGDVLWYIHRDPYYDASDTYGKGGPLHFIWYIKEVLGGPMLMLLALAIVLSGVRWVRNSDERKDLNRLLFLTLAPAVAILVVHSFLWWQGMKGSLGLLRVLATGVPLTVLFVLTILSRTITPWFITRRGQWVAGLVAGVVFVRFALVAFNLHHPFPVKADAYQAFLNVVGERIVAIKPAHQRVVFYHPYLAFRAELDPYDSTTAFHCRGLNMTPEDPGLSSGDLLVWDSHFGPNEGRTPLQALLDHPGLRLVEAFTPRESMKVLGGYPFEVMLFVRDQQRREALANWFVLPEGAIVPMGQRLDTMACAAGTAWCFNAGEFPMELSAFPLNGPGAVMTALTVSGTFRWEGEPGDGLNLVFSEEEDGIKLSYWPEKVAEGEFSFTFHAPARSSKATNKLYFWNTTGKPFRVEGFSVQATRYRAP